MNLHIRRRRHNLDEARRSRAVTGTLSATIVALVAGCFSAASAGAAVSSGHAPHANNRSNTQLVMSGTGPGRTVSGFIAEATNPFDPVTEGYPTSNPSTSAGSGWKVKDGVHAAIIYAKTVDGNTTLSMYCIQLETVTYAGIGYTLSDWDGAAIPNLGYVSRLLNDYYPQTSAPTNLSNDSDKAAAVQAAIWFFSDRFVLNTSQSIRAEVVKIVNQVIAQGPEPSPKPPSLKIEPSLISGPHGQLHGPFTVTTDHPPATLTATGATMYANAAGTDEIPNGAAVQSGQRIWLRSGGPGTAVLQASSKAIVPSGNVYLYDGNTPGVDEAQTLIIAKPGELNTTVSATADFEAPGSLRVTKTIAGEAAGDQGEVKINVDCDDGVDRPVLSVPAGASAGSTSHTYHDIPAGTKCTVIETANGSVVGVDVVITGDGTQTTIKPDQTATATVKDTYSHVTSTSASLEVTKTIAGPSAGHQGPVTIAVSCGGEAVGTIQIPAGTPAGSVVHRFDDLTPGAVCEVTETADGETDGVSVTVEGGHQQVTVHDDEVATVNVADIYTEAAVEPDEPDSHVGGLHVFKTIAGPAAGRQGAIAILIDCGTLHTYAFGIAARHPAGTVSRWFSQLPAGARCVVTETAVGAGHSIGVSAGPRRQVVTIRRGKNATVRFRDSFFPVGKPTFTG